MKMESQKILNFLDHKDENYPRFQTKKWNGKYGQGDDVHSIIKFNTEIVKPFLCDYADAYSLVTGDINVEAANNDTRVAIKNCHPFTKDFFKLNDSQVNTADNLDLTINLYNMLEYSDNYADTTASFYQYKRPEPRYANGVLAELTTNNSSSFKYQSGLVQKQLATPNLKNVNANIDPNFNISHKLWKDIKIVVLLKYISSFNQYKDICRIELDKIFSAMQYKSKINISSNKS